MHFKDYSPAVIDHFFEPRNNYEMQDADGVGQAGDPSCGDAMGIYIRVRNGRIQQASFVVMGCVGAIASGSMTTVLAEGKTIAEAMELTPQKIADALGGLPDYKIHCSVLGADALKRAIEDYYKNQSNKNMNNQEENKMRIAVAAMGTTVAGHFGHCENFMIFDTADGKITAVQSIPNPGHRPGFLPNFLADNGAQVIVSGGMGGGAVDIFNERGVEVIVGIQGDAQTAVEAYLRGELISTGSICHQHEHAHECGGHH